jgi:hypothetical protein
MEHSVYERYLSLYQNILLRLSGLVQSSKLLKCNKNKAYKTVRMSCKNLRGIYISLHEHPAVYLSLFPLGTFVPSGLQKAIPTQKSHEASQNAFSFTTIIRKYIIPHPTKPLQSIISKAIP